MAVAFFERNHSRRKTTTALATSLSLKIYKTLSLNNVLTSMERRFEREMLSLCNCYICCLIVLFSIVKSPTAEKIEIILSSDQEAKMVLKLSRLHYFYYFLVSFWSNAPYLDNSTLRQ